MRESRYQKDLVKRLYELFPDALIIKNDPTFIQGIPDLLILWNDQWAMLEVKASNREEIQPNQEYYVSLFDNMSFASFIYPENERVVLDALQSAFGSPRKTRLFEPQ